jgi:hypothetical protein
MGIVIDESGAPGYVCLECGFSDEVTSRSAHDRRRTDVEV